VMTCQPAQDAVATVISYHLSVGEGISANEMPCVHFNFATVTDIKPHLFENFHSIIPRREVF
jgi:hypothetical protein